MKTLEFSRPRKLKIVDVGDFYHHKEVPEVRLKGLWLSRAGLQPGKYVQITNPRKGLLIIQSLD
ncbi:MAG: SymE family type I addiction module toxin [Candidatus Atribacteria bacterium]|nr:SymE family type I addiction module toxin [Candidatus Atribacteria bacterium]